ncbi:hypothetical protein GQX74_004562 [Glossina fuscipes]|nr:hypothetical protein GQX74_004562 [Glossina fuscipes]
MQLRREIKAEMCFLVIISLTDWEDVQEKTLFIQLNFTPMFFVLQLLNAVVVTQAFQIVFQNLITQSIGSFKSFGSTIICNNQRNNNRIEFFHFLYCFFIDFVDLVTRCHGYIFKS